MQLPGTVDSTPIYLHGVTVAGKQHDVFFVTTTYGRTIAVDAAAAKVLWTYTPPGYSSWAGSYRITNAAPVADPSRRYVYAAAPDGKVRKLAVANGHQVWSTAVTRLPEREKLASALTFDRGHVIVPTDGYIGDQPPYQGHVTLLDAASGRAISTWNSLCSDRHGIIAPASCPGSDSAIWARSGVVVEPGTHRLLFATGNGPYDGHTNWGDSVIELAPNAGVLTRHWTPADFQQLEDSDADLGSTGPALLPGGWFVQGGKDGKLRLIRLSRMAGNDPRTGGETQVVPTPGGTLLFG
ncbi:MAG: outer membrane protein assembly factor BamB family protein, partial [Gaiellaceae bacterium]